MIPCLLLTRYWANIEVVIFILHSFYVRSSDLMIFLSRLSINTCIGKGILWLISLLMMVEKTRMGIGLSVSIMGLEDMILFRYFKLFCFGEYWIFEDDTLSMIPEDDYWKT